MESHQSFGQQGKATSGSENCINSGKTHKKTPEKTRTRVEEKGKTFHRNVSIVAKKKTSLAPKPIFGSVKD